MEEMTKHGRIGHAAMKAGMDRNTARRYVAAGKLPSELVKARDWRTREDPFVEDWPELELLLVASPAPVVDGAVRGDQRAGALVAAHHEFEEILGGGGRQCSSRRSLLGER